MAISLAASGMVGRSTYASTNADLVNPLTMIPAAFDMAAYDDVNREPGRGKTIRWMSSPSIYVDTSPEVGTGMPIPASWISATQAAAGRFPAQWTGGVLSSSVSVGGSPPQDGTPGTIVIRFDNTINPSGCGGKVGQATFGWSGSGELAYGVVQLALSRLCGASSSVIEAVVGHEIGHTMGLGHLTVPGRSSLMEPSVRLAGLSPLDRENASVHYHRAPGHAAPDREPASSASLNFSRVWSPGGPGDRKVYVCGEDLDPR
ncbi:MAG: M57 family metalloprotease [Gemmatimonadota bacterium]